MGSLEKNPRRKQYNTKPCGVMNKTDLKERILLSEKFPLIKIMGEKTTEETTNKGNKDP